MNRASQPQDVNPDVASLATLGMRIRKAVADGYALRDNSHLSYDPQYFSRPQTFDRVALPSGMDAPPSLSNDGLTFQSGLNVSEWGAPQMNMTTMPFNAGTKRRADDESVGMFDKNFFLPRAEVQFPSYEEFSAGSGQLSFNEDF